jgi:hypothetical protein
MQSDDADVLQKAVNNIDMELPSKFRLPPIKNRV